MDFLNSLDENLKKKDLTQSSINAYIKNIERLLEGKPLTKMNLAAALKDIPRIEEFLSEKKDNTKRAYYISIVSVLDTLKGEKKFSKLYRSYYEKMMGINDELKKIPTSTKSEAQEKNWMEWDQINEVYNEWKEKAYNIAKKKTITEPEFNTILHFMVLSLFVNNKPRRNSDYYLCDVVGDITGIEGEDHNFLDYPNQRFIFNKYKSFKKHGSQIIDISPELFQDIQVYLRHHPSIQGKITKKTREPFLVWADGKNFQANTITRILNRVFKKKISSSMLRHIFLSNKYGDVLEEMKKDSEDMAHTLETQKSYIKN